MGCLYSKEYKQRIHLTKEEKVKIKKIIKILNLPITELYSLIYESSDVSDYLKCNIMFTTDSRLTYINKLEIYVPIRISSYISDCVIINFMNKYVSFKTEYISTSPHNNKYLIPDYSYSYKPKLIDMDEEECSICYDSKCNFKLPCKHKYCFNCINSIYLSKNNKCPFCRSLIREQDIYNFETDHVIYHPYQKNYYVINNKKCLICKNKYANRTTICGHNYCFECILTHIIKNNKCCPECQVPI